MTKLTSMGVGVQDIDTMIKRATAKGKSLPTMLLSMTDTQLKRLDTECRPFAKCADQNAACSKKHQSCKTRKAALLHHRYARRVHARPPWRCPGVD